jgi:hypothetical protein
MVGRRYRVTAWNWFCPVFVTIIKKSLQFLPYGRSIGSWICLTHKTYTCHTLQDTYSASMAVSDSQSIFRFNLRCLSYSALFCFLSRMPLYINGCLGFHDILVYWNESTLYNFRTSNYVQQRKTYTIKAAKVHLNCYSVITVT